MFTIGIIVVWLIIFGVGLLVFRTLRLRREDRELIARIDYIQNRIAIRVGAWRRGSGTSVHV